MKISYNWLKEFIDFDLTPTALQEELTIAGLEVEGVEEHRLDYPGIVVGKVLSKEAHPNADKLSVCVVEIGSPQPLTIVCGAANVAAGQTVAVAQIGARLPNDLKIRKAKIRGVQSEGMICAQDELKLNEKSDGIWVLPSELPIGQALATALNYKTDYVFDVSVTPNRPDALSHIGIAREIAAIVEHPLHIPEPVFPETSQSPPGSVQVDILCPESCPRYAARLIRNVQVAASPEWLVRRLESVGMRSINNIVDITNLVMLETGQPLHAFDFELLSGGKIIVRESLEGETFVTLDEKAHQLKQGTVLICDAEKPVALGGIMGGQNSEIHSGTRHLLLESAYFQAESIQRSLRYLGISTESSQRFERGANPNGVIHAQNRAAALLVELAGGEACQAPIDCYPKQIHPISIDLKAEQINNLLGISLSAAEMGVLLSKIGLQVKDNRVIVPTFRPDIKQTADIAEEVGRLYGYDNIPLSDRITLPYQSEENLFVKYVDYLKDTLTGLGCQEVITNSMINSKTWEEVTAQAVYPILNPISKDMNGLRNSLIPSLLGVIQWNMNRQIRDLAIFEINKTFQHSGDLKQQPIETLTLGIALTGKRHGTHWCSDRQLYDFYDIKGILEYLTEKISLDKLELIPYDNFAVENQALKIISGNNEIGFIGKTKRSLENYFDIETPVYVAELNIQALHQQQTSRKYYQEVPKYPWVERDLAVIVKETQESQQLIEAICKAGGQLLKTAFVFDIYTGKQLEAGQKSIAIRLIFQSSEKTLTEAEINHWTDHILDALINQFQVKLRS